MNSVDHLNKEIERYKRELMGYASNSAQVDALRKMAGGMSSFSVENAMNAHQSLLMKEREQLQRAVAPFDSITHLTANIHNLTGLSAAQEAERSWNEAAGLTAAASFINTSLTTADIQKLTGLSSAQETLREWSEASGLAAAASAINASLNGFASKIADEFSAGQNSLSQRLRLTASQTLASNILGQNTFAELSSHRLAASSTTLRTDVASITEGLQATFSLAGLAGTTALEKAIAAACGTIGSEYSDRFDFERRVREMVGGLSAFDLARTVAIAQLQGVDGIARQMATLGLEPDEYLEDGDTQAPHGGIGAHLGDGLPQMSLEVFKNLLINLIISYIVAVFVNPLIPNPDLESQTKKLARVESLIEKLPQAIEAQVESMIRHQLLAEDSFLVVKKRDARLHKTPVSGSGVVALVYPNQKLKVLEERGKWIRVEFYDYLKQTTQEGWILKKYCKRWGQSVDQERSLDEALAQTRADMAAGRMVQESPEAHLARLDAMNQAS